MRQLKLYIATSLDGKIARNDDGLDWLPDPTEDDYGYTALLDSTDSLLMGYATYKVTSGFGEWPYKNKKTYVFTRDAAKTGSSGIQLITEDPVSFTRALKEEAGTDIWLVGGGQIIRQLHDAGLVDEYIIAIIPVVLGTGIELFPDINREQSLRLNKHKVYSNGLALMYYTRTAT